MGLAWHSSGGEQGGLATSTPQPPAQETSGWTPENVALLLGSFGTIITQLDRIATALESGSTPVDVIPDCVLVTESGTYLVDEAGSYVLQDCEIPDGALVDEAGVYLVSESGATIVALYPQNLVTESGASLVNEAGLQIVSEPA